MSVLCQPVSQLGKCCTKMCLFSWNNMVSHTTYSVCGWHVGWVNTYCYVYESLSRFFTIYPDQVSVTSSFCGAVLSCLWSLSVNLLLCSLLSIALPFWLLSACLLYCALWMLLLFVYALAYAIGLLLICFNMSSNGSVCVCDCFVLMLL